MSAKGLFLVRANSGQDYLAAAEIFGRKIPIHLSHRHWREKVNNRAKTCTELRLRPYIFVALSVDNSWPGVTQKTIDEAGVVQACRGVERLFCASNGHPQRQRDVIVEILRGMELDELSFSEKAKLKKLAAFEPKALVRIVNHPLWGGFEGEVLASARGMSYVAVNGKTLDVPDLHLVRLSKDMRKSA